ncbi:hypothetical protein BDY17DRAFT_298023 [Neohortaea acidophila]|uniref:Uncharacterized protein n=1 Tax=Neohortaea acidophila TaxID=245834 RepID=A0A6A6PUU2_9PEZI|nr:uncharacterized protein BDY17DRAFT_298023 [Neohortaea acidophila]KAF2483752.1 hypothetical protein BDY17DRAFT_298023 [Neohortaea acidophila]
MAHLAARVAATAGGTTTEAQSRAVGLDVAEALTVVALLGLHGAGVRAIVALVPGLLAVVAQALTAGAHLGVVADVAAFVAGAARQGRHFALRVLLFFLLFTSLLHVVRSETLPSSSSSSASSSSSSLSRNNTSAAETRPTACKLSFRRKNGMWRKEGKEMKQKKVKEALGGICEMRAGARQILPRVA